MGGSPPWVRIPPLPPLALAKPFSRSGCGRIFPLFSRVMRVGLLTGPRPERRTRVLSGPIFSKADDCADLVLSFKALNMNGYFQWYFLSVCENVRLADKTGVGNALSKTDFPRFIPAKRDPLSLCVLFNAFVLIPPRPIRTSRPPCFQNYQARRLQI